MRRRILSWVGALCWCIGFFPAAAWAADAARGGWEYGVYIDLSYADDLDGSGRVPWRSKLTTSRLNQFDPNMGMAYARKLATADSPWGFELGGQAGYDTDGQVPANSRLPGYSILRYVSRANVSYRVPVGSGLNLTAGLMNSFIGFESFYAKDNPNYTRSWIADYSPYFLMGIGGQYAVSDELAIGLYLLSDFNYLAYVNDQPKYGSQIAWNFAPQWRLTQNLFLGPEQPHTAIRYWRAFSDTILQWSHEDFTAALAYDVGTEQRSEGATRQTVWMGSALFTRWHIDGPWSVGLRPELYWDPDGQLTGARQFIKAVTATLEYRWPVGPSNLAVRAEYRHDDSTGKGGGFFDPGTGTMALVAGQNTFFLACLWSYDGP
jgi:hypothetical protein